MHAKGKKWFKNLQRYVEQRRHTAPLPDRNPLRKVAGVVAESQDKIDAGKEDECHWDLQDAAATYKISIEQVKTEDGNEWKPTAGFERSVRTK